MEDWKQRLTGLGFRPTEHGGMRGKFEDIEIVAVDHPWKGLCLMGHHFDERSATEFETFIPVDADSQAIAKALIHIYHLVHPKKQPTPPPKPERKRPPNEEALATVPDLMRQFYGVLDEMSFLFQRSPLMPEGYLDQKIGEVLVAYVYDLELTQNQSDFSEAKSSDGRRVQVRTTRSLRGTVPTTTL